MNDPRFIGDRNNDSQVNRDDLAQVDVISVRIDGRTYTSTTRSLGTMALYEELIPDDAYRALVERYAVIPEGQDATSIQLSAAEYTRFRRDLEGLARQSVVGSADARTNTVAYYRELQAQGMLPETITYLPRGNYRSAAEARDALVTRSVSEILARMERTGVSDDAFMTYATWLSEGSVVHLNGLPLRIVQCDNTYMIDYRLNRGQEVKLPTDDTPRLHPIASCVGGVCTVTIQLERLVEPPVPDVAPLAPRIPAQAIMTPSGAYDNAVGFDGHAYFYGEPPRDAAALGPMERGRDTGAGIRSDVPEGTRTRTGRDGGTDQTLSAESEDQRRYTFTRAGDELTRGPEQSVFVNARGEPGGPNRAYNQKIEHQTRWVVTPDGQLTTTSDASAVISINRRRNPDHAGIFSDVDTARNVIDRWSNSGEGQLTLTRLRAIEDYRQPLLARFEGQTVEGATAPLTVADAERALQLNVQLALHPAFWSVDRGGIPLGDVDQLRGDMQTVFDSPAFAALTPPEEQARLRSTYEPMINVLDRPEQLVRLVEEQPAPATHLYGEVSPAVEAALRERNFIGDGATGRAGYFDPLADMAINVRSQVPFIRDNYYHREDESNARLNDAQRQERSAITGLNYAVGARIAFRSPVRSEYNLSTAFDMPIERQQPSTLAEREREFVDELRADPELRARWIDHVLATEGSFDNISNMLFHPTRANAPDNRRILAFESDSAADNFTRDTAERLAGRDYRDRAEYRGPGMMERAFGGWPIVGGLFRDPNRNQNQGLDGMDDATLARWQDPATRAEVDAAFLGVLDRTALANDQGNVIGIEMITDTMSPNLSEDRNRDAGRGFTGSGETSDTYAAVIGERGSDLDRLFRDREAVRLRAVGNIPGNVELALDASGVERVQVDQATLSGYIDRTLAGQDLPSLAGQVTGDNTVAGPLLQGITDPARQQASLQLFATHHGLARVALGQWARGGVAAEEAIITAARANASELPAEVTDALARLDATNTNQNRRRVVNALVRAEAGPAHSAIVGALASDQAAASAVYGQLVAIPEFANAALGSFNTVSGAAQLSAASGLPLADIRSAQQAAGLYTNAIVGGWHAAGTPGVADNPTIVSRGETNAAVTLAMARNQPSMFTSMLISQLASGAGTPEGRAQAATAIQALNAAGGDSREYARLVARHVNALRTADPSEIQALQAQMLTEVGQFFAGQGDSPDAINASLQSRALMAGQLGDTLAGNTQSAELMAGAYNAINANPNGAIDALLANGSINATQADALRASMQELLSLRASGDPDALNAWLGQFSDQSTDALNARFGINRQDILWLGFAVLGFHQETSTITEVIRRFVDPTKGVIDQGGLVPGTEGGWVEETITTETRGWEFSTLRAAGGLILGSVIRTGLEEEGGFDRRDNYGQLGNAVRGNEDRDDRDDRHSQGAGQEMGYNLLTGEFIAPAPTPSRDNSGGGNRGPRE